MQAGARRYPEPPFPHQHLKKPGTEADLDLAPMYDAPHYKGSEKLQGKWRSLPARIPESGERLPCCLRARARMLALATAASR
jgi:hypothetical protein